VVKLRSWIAIVLLWHRVTLHLWRIAIRVIMWLRVNLRRIRIRRELVWLVVDTLHTRRLELVVSLVVDWSLWVLRRRVMILGRKSGTFVEFFYNPLVVEELAEVESWKVTVRFVLVVLGHTAVKGVLRAEIF
jgi:hypothetical protein